MVLGRLAGVMPSLCLQWVVRQQVGGSAAGAAQARPTICSPAPSLRPVAALQVEEGIDALYDLIWHIESYEQVRAGGAPSCWLDWHDGTMAGPVMPARVCAPAWRAQHASTLALCHT